MSLRSDARAARQVLRAGRQRVAEVDDEFEVAVGLDARDVARAMDEQRPIDRSRRPLRRMSAASRRVERRAVVKLDIRPKTIRRLRSSSSQPISRRAADGPAVGADLRQAFEREHARRAARRRDRSPATVAFRRRRCVSWLRLSASAEVAAGAACRQDARRQKKTPHDPMSDGGVRRRADARVEARRRAS